MDRRAFSGRCKRHEGDVSISGALRRATVEFWHSKTPVPSGLADGEMTAPYEDVATRSRRREFPRSVAYNSRLERRHSGASINLCTLAQLTMSTRRIDVQEHLGSDRWQ